MKGSSVCAVRSRWPERAVRTVIMSLWAVEDGATRQMDGQQRRCIAPGCCCYHLDTADAVRQASLAATASAVRTGSTHPFYRAAFFVAAGDGIDVPLFYQTTLRGAGPSARPCVRRHRFLASLK